ncbi:glycosyltransferase family 39 protein [Corallococcus macrosporus]|uniref:Dolichyl-phosphate-mannose--protein mannosyltransferase n=1 Tax=Corallococcus macrosporus DSM 14697 TaxID=1189310 RepID=A0A250JST3_9BACT|nr:glycosyltransferase family 39 protein [Corallococcus macrosporus]ATB46176.1 dolichyl-phosphate-mannose--protein mannosyltransferase [Corallococcus macrosporus DSM 14697]
MRADSQTVPAPPDAFQKRLDGLLIAALVVWGLTQLAPHLAHPAIYIWDESMHQAATRGTHDTFFTPHLYKDPLYPTDPRHWWAAHVWMHKPTGPFWFGALMMHVVGVTPLALRLASLLGHLAAAVSIYLIARRPAGRPWAVLGAAGFLAMPFGWQLVQGRFFGDVTDCTLTGCNAVAVALLFHATRQGSWRWGVAAGAAVGLGFLCKTGLALTPLGIAGTLWALGRLRFCPGPSFGTVVAMVGAAVLLAAPWSLYSAWRWPELHELEARVTRAHLFHDPTVDVGPWHRPVDALFNEVNTQSLAPLPPVVPVLAFGWLLVRALRRRELEVVGLALWVGATWFVLTLGVVKVPAIAWGAVPAVLAALAISGADARRHPALAAALLAGLFTPWFIQHLPALGRVRAALPPVLAQTRERPGLAEGLVVVAVAALLVGLVCRLLPRKLSWAPLGVGLLASAVLAWHLAVTLPVARARYLSDHLDDLYVTYSREVGRALDQQTPARSVLFLAQDFDVPHAMEYLSLMFWSNRMAYRRPPDVPTARRHRYHPYLVSPLAERYAPVPGVPPDAALRAYDLLAPRPAPAALPDGVTPLSFREKNMEVLGVAVGHAGGGRDRYAFFVRAHGAPHSLRVVFQGRGGRLERSLDPGAARRRDAALRNASWFIVPVLGPPGADVTHLELGSDGQQVTLSLPGA